jgi:hypothetical protein
MSVLGDIAWVFRRHSSTVKGDIVWVFKETYYECLRRHSMSV